MEIIKNVKGKEIKEDYKSGFIISNLPPKELVKKAIKKEKYKDKIIIKMETSDYNEFLIETKISDFLTLKEYQEILKLKNFN